jgi:hypothetical protein
MRIKTPDHPVPQLTTFELRDYRSRLEEALGTDSLDAAIRTTLQGQLAEVIGEQESRTRGTRISDA